MDTSQFIDLLTHDATLELLDRQGATCDTYRVKLYGKLHFLKRLKEEYAKDVRYQEAFNKEFETGYRLEHPCLVRYIAHDSNGILMEYVDGETLAERIAYNPDYFTRKNTEKFVNQLLDVVQYLHSHQVLHLDLKPDNILLTRINGDVKLVDLGCCYTDTFVDTQGCTATYAAPEQLQGGSVDERSDIYAIGRILEQLPNASLYNKVIARCKAENPQNRYQSIPELQIAVGHARPSLFRLLWVLPILAVAVFFYVKGQSPVASYQPVVTDTLVQVKEPTDTPIISKPIPENVSTTKQQVSDSPQASTRLTAPAKRASIDQLRSDICRMVFPVFQSTLGSVEHPSQNDSLWMAQSHAFLAGEQQRIEKLVRMYSDISMDTVVKEYRDYVQQLIIQAANQ